jgi:hypothetical protein
VFEREGGVGIYNINTRQGAKIAFNGELAAIERSGSQGLFFIITSQSGARKKLTGIRLPDAVILEAPFKSEGAFLGRAGSRLFVGGGTTLACFELEKK